MRSIVPDGTPRQVLGGDPCWEYLGMARGYCPQAASGWMDDRTFCAKHLHEREQFRAGIRPGGDA